MCEVTPGVPADRTPLTHGEPPLDTYRATYVEAAHECAAHGYRLCELSEIAPGGGASSPCLNTGCG